MPARAAQTASSPAIQPDGGQRLADDLVLAELGRERDRTVAPRGGAVGIERHRPPVRHRAVRARELRSRRERLEQRDRRRGCVVGLLPQAAYQ
jgi:hypothetical protein